MYFGACICVHVRGIELTLKLMSFARVLRGSLKRPCISLYLARSSERASSLIVDTLRIGLRSKRNIDQWCQFILKKQENYGTQSYFSSKMETFQKYGFNILHDFDVGIKSASTLFWKSPLWAIAMVVWELEVLSLKFQFLSYCLLYYFVLNTSVGKILFSLALIPLYGFAEQNSPWLLINYYLFLLEGYFIHLICKIFPTFYDFLKQHFGSEFLQEFCGNSIFNKIRGHLLISIAYPVFRALDERHTDSRVNQRFNELYDKVRKTSDFSDTKAEVFELHDKAMKQVGQPWIHRVEQAVATGGTELPKSLKVYQNPLKILINRVL